MAEFNMLILLAVVCSFWEAIETLLTLCIVSTVKADIEMK